MAHSRDHHSPQQIFERSVQAQHRIQHLLEPTPVTFDSRFHCWLKCEHEQITGSFKVRGALAKLSELPKGSEVITASTGNHGLGTAFAANAFGHQLKVFIPRYASRAKKEKLQKSGVEIVEVDGDSLAAESAGKAFAAQNDLPWVSPYNDPDVISGQGIIGLELLAQISSIEEVLVTVGGGGLIAGIASVLKTVNPDVRIIGCQPVNSPEMYLSTLAGHVVNAPEARDTLSDGSAGPLEPDSITFPLCRMLIDAFELVSEEEIKKALGYLYVKHNMVVEGSAGVAMAVAQRRSVQSSGINRVVILCGGNIDPDIHQHICGEYSADDPD